MINWHKSGQKICQYLRDHYEPWHGATMRRLRDYLRWYWQRNLMAVIWHRGKIVALCLIRLGNNPENFAFHFRHDPAGAICWIDIMIAESPFWATATLAKFAAMHAGNTTFKGIFMWSRMIDSDRWSRPRCYTYDRFRKLVTLFTKGAL